jgi:hypothetical protein
MFPPNVEVILGYEPVTIKVKAIGNGLYFGEPKKRHDPLIGPDGTEWNFRDPRFEQPDF